MGLDRIHRTIRITRLHQLEGESMEVWEAVTTHADKKMMWIFFGILSSILPSKLR